MSQNIINEVVANFGKRSSVYDQYSRIQKLSCQLLAERIPASNYQKALDLGCGTGFSISVLQDLALSVTGLDASSEMLEYVRNHRPSVETVQGDFDNLGNCLKNKYDLIFSNFSFQWSKNLTALFSSLGRFTTKETFIAVALPIEESLGELVDAFHAIGEDGFINKFYTENEVKEAVQDANLQNFSLSVSSETIRLVYPSVIDILHSISKIGAYTNTNSNNKHPLTKEILKKLIDYTEKNSIRNNVFSVSWKICFIIGSRI